MTKKRTAPRIIVIGGYSGTGKSTLSQGLKQVLPQDESWVVLDADIVRKDLWGVDSTTPLPDEAYSDEMHMKTAAEMARRAENAVMNGRSVIMNSTYLCDAARERVEKMVAGLDIPAAGLFLTADFETLEQRIAMRKENPSDVTPESLKDQFNGQKVFFSDFWRVLDSRHSAEDVRKSALDYIAHKTGSVSPSDVPPAPKRG